MNKGRARPSLHTRQQAINPSADFAMPSFRPLAVPDIDRSRRECRGLLDDRLHAGKQCMRALLDERFCVTLHQF